jgi:hypothetical protein
LRITLGRPTQNPGETARRFSAGNLAPCIIARTRWTSLMAFGETVCSLFPRAVATRTVYPSVLSVMAWMRGVTPSQARGTLTG